MSIVYSEKVIEHFTKPRNVGEIKNPDGVGQVGNRICGDVMKVYIRVSKAASGKNKGKEIIKDIKFQTLGCAAAIATSSMITELAKNKTLDEAMKITRKDVSKSLGSLPAIKEHCSNLSADALHEAIKDYKIKQKSKN